MSYNNFAATVSSNDAYAQSFMNDEREADERRAAEAEAAAEAERERQRQEAIARRDASFSVRSAARNRSFFGGSRRYKKSKQSKKSKKSRKSRR